MEVVSDYHNRMKQSYS